MKAIAIQTICSSTEFDFKDRFFQIFDWPLWEIVSATAEASVCFNSSDSTTKLSPISREHLLSVLF